MASKETPLLSAQVNLKSASGRPVRGGDPIPAEALRDDAPSNEAIAAARDAFRDLGFDAGPFDGVSFSISAPAAIFEGVFGCAPKQQEQGLQTGNLPEPLHALIESVTVP